MSTILTTKQAQPDLPSGDDVRWWIGEDGIPRTIDSAGVIHTFSGGLPTGGALGQFLKKNSGTDFDFVWDYVVTHNAGVTSTSAPTITDNGNGTCNVGAFTFALYDNANYAGAAKEYSIGAATNVGPFDETGKYMCVDYNSGTPIVSVKTSAQINGSSIVPFAKCWWDGAYLHILDADSQGIGLPNKIANMIISTRPYSRANESGLSLGEKTGRFITVSASYVFSGVNGINVFAYDSETDLLTFAYWNGVAWVYDRSLHFYSNTQYNPVGGLTTLSNNKYTVIWVYRPIGDVKEVFYVLGDAEYSSVDTARLAKKRSDIPPVIAQHCMLVGRMIVQKSASSAAEIESAFDTAFASSGVSDHAALANLQGGAASEYYHLTSAQLTQLLSMIALPGYTKEATGFADPSAVIQNYDSATRKVTLSGTFVALWRGTVFPTLTAGWVSDAHDDIAGTWFLCYNGTGFVWSQTPWTFDVLQIAAVVKKASYVFGIRECHGLMPYLDHEEAHDRLGTYRKSGGALSSYVLNSTAAADRRPDIAATIVKDEDIPTTNPQLTSKSYTQFSLTGSGVAAFATAQSDIIPLSGNQPYYNQLVGGSWQQSLMSNNNYAALFLVAVPVTSDSNSQLYRYFWVQPQTQNSSLTTVQAITPTNVTLGDFSTLAPEFVFIKRVIIQYVSGNWKLIQEDTIDLARAQSVSSSAPLDPKIREILTGSGTWIKPSGARFVRVTVQGAGGGGGGGGASSGSSIMSGGGGGSGGTSQTQVFLADDLDNSISYSCGVGGGGGTGGLSNAGAGTSNGSGGSRGGSTSFGTYLFAAGGSAGGGGTTTSGTGGANTAIYTHGTVSTTDAGAGGNGSNTTPIAGNNGSSGGGGGGAGPSNGAGANGGSGRAYLLAAPTGTTTRGSGAAGGLYNNNGTTATTLAHGGGGAGGHSETDVSGTHVGPTGGAGYLGGGGGGGGATTCGGGGANARGGTGGAGGDGYIEVMVW